jgi:hypothetical protein
LGWLTRSSESYCASTRLENTPEVESEKPLVNGKWIAKADGSSKESTAREYCISVGVELLPIVRVLISGSSACFASKGLECVLAVRVVLLVDHNRANNGQVQGMDRNSATTGVSILDAMRVDRDRSTHPM